MTKGKCSDCFVVHQLAFVLEADLDYWYRSARLLARARQWEKTRERSLTLRGKELKEAERGQQEGATKSHPQVGLLPAFLRPA